MTIAWILICWLIGSVLFGICVGKIIKKMDR